MKRMIKLLKCYPLLLIVASMFSLLGCRKQGTNETKMKDGLQVDAVVSSTIIYTDVIPDSTCQCTLPFALTRVSCSAIFYIDVNKDGINDFSIAAIHQRGWPPTLPATKINSRTTATPLNGNAFCDTAMSINNVIKGSLNWSTSSQSMASLINNYSCNGWNCHWLNTLIISGRWNGLNDRYLPLKMIVGTNTYYGWARLNVAIGGASFTIKDYAYNSVANQSILAGQKL